MSGKGTPAAGQPEPGERAGSRDFSAPPGPAASGRLIFVSGASDGAFRADFAMPYLYRARFEGRVPTVVARGAP